MKFLITTLATLAIISSPLSASPYPGFSEKTEIFSDKTDGSDRIMFHPSAETDPARGKPRIIH